ncbi:hypothetical protein WBJ53_26015 [Spirosoma sp. SC4-14]|uniref:hypothetical protein n=1 Tax=Spirosoma sp. SC4-14 TaxID=3128900 RepID=UPI0030CDF9F7
MEQTTQPNPLLELNKQQLKQWEDLKANLSLADPNDSRIGYCDRRIVNIQAEVNRLAD